MNTKKKKEKLFNIPNALTTLRVILSALLVVMAFQGFRLIQLVVIFAIAAITDGLDGYIARRYKLNTEFGRKFDIIADRILMISAIIAIVAYFSINNKLTQKMITELALIISREIICAPFFIVAWIFAKRPLPPVRMIGKAVTLFQGITFPMILLGWPIAIYFAGLTAITGIISGILYAKDSCFS